jgi:DNA modification methylase
VRTERVGDATIYTGDVLEVLRTMPDESVHCVVTSPPYWGLRDYGVAGQIGLEKTPEEYVTKMVEVFREVRRVLRGDGTLWLNLGSSYASGDRSTYRCGASDNKGHLIQNDMPRPGTPPGFKPKDMIPIPWMVAMALQADGWYLRQDIIWDKGNPMPESVRDRCCKSHEYVFLLSKSARYYFDAEAIKEDASGSENLGSQIQYIGEGAGGSASLLLFGERSEDEESVSQEIRTDAGAKRTLSTSGQEAREGIKVQRAHAPILAERKREDDESREGQAIREDGQGTILETQDRDQAQASDQNSRLHADSATVAGDQGEISESLRLLPKEISTSGNGSRHTAIEGREAYSAERSTGLPNVQRQERQPAKRTKRSVWHINCEPYPNSHFATFPRKLVQPCILAGCPEHACPDCGAPWVKEVEREYAATDRDPPPNKGRLRAFGEMASGMTASGFIPNRKYMDHIGPEYPTCACGLAPIGGIVLDPFGGSGTTAEVALEYGRRAILIELKPEYVELAKKRLRPIAGRPMLDFVGSTEEREKS